MNEPTATITLTDTDLGYLKAGLAAHRNLLAQYPNGEANDQVEAVERLHYKLIEAQIDAAVAFRKRGTDAE